MAQEFPELNPKPLKPETIRKRIHSAEGRLADTITAFAGSMGFVYLNGAIFLLWFIINEGLFEPFIPVFDPFPYGLLTMIVSLEAIFLATFIMVAQNRQALIEEYRELEEEAEQQEEEKQQEELEEEVEDIQKDLDEIKNAIELIAKKVVNVEKIQHKVPPKNT